MLRCKSTILCLLLVAWWCSGSLALSCKDRNGNDVDWWFARKVPGSWHYIYIDSNELTEEEYVYPKEQLYDTKSPLSHTMLQMQNTSIQLGQPGWVMYNEDLKGGYNLANKGGFKNVKSKTNKQANAKTKSGQPKMEPVVKPSKTPYAHAKGFVAYNPSSTNKEGFHVMHSCPGFPMGAVTNQAAFTMPDGTINWMLDSAKKNGQQFMCYNFEKASEVMESLELANVHFYRTNIDLTQSLPAPVTRILDPKHKFARAKYRACKKAVKDKTNVDTTCADKREFKLGNTDFTYLVQSSYYNKDIWDRAVIKAGNNIMHVQNWRRNGGTLGATPTLFDSASYGTITDEYNWDDTDDHAKLGWTADPVKKYSCAGDLNREYSQKIRGGALLCSNNYAMASLLNRMERQYYTQSADKSNIAAVLAPDLSRQVDLKFLVDYDKNPLGPLYPIEAQDFDADHYFVPKLLASKAKILKANIPVTITNVEYALPLATKDVAVCDCKSVEDGVCSLSKARHHVTGAPNFVQDATYDIFKYIARLRNEWNKEILAAKATQDTNLFLGVCIDNNKLQQSYNMVRAQKRGYIKIELQNNNWCHQCIAVEFARWVLHIVNPTLIRNLDRIALQDLKAPSTIDSMPLYQGLIYALGLHFRYSKGPTFDYPKPDDTSKMPKMIFEDEYNKQINIEVNEPTKIFGPTATDDIQTIPRFVIAAIWDMLDENDDNHKDLPKGDAQFAHSAARITVTDILSVYHGYTFTGTAKVRAKEFLEAVLVPIKSANQKTYDYACYTLEYNKIVAEKSCTGSRKRDIFEGIPSFSDLRALLGSYSFDTTLVNAADFEAIYTDALSYWFHPNLMSWDSNRLLNTVAYRLNMQNDFTALRTVTFATPNALQYDFQLRYSQDTPTIPAIVDPTALLYYSNIIKIIASYGTNIRQFSELSYIFWPLPVDILRATLLDDAIMSNSNMTGMAIVVFNGKLCNYFATSYSDLQLRVPSSGDCPTGPIIANVMPLHGPAAGNVPITISGYSFDTVSSVTIGGKSCGSVTNPQTGKIVCSIPAGISINLPIVVSNSHGANLLGTWFFSYDAPTLTSITPTNATSLSGGSSAIITGRNFGPPSTYSVDDMLVLIGEVPCQSITHNSDTQITCVIPAGSGSGNVVSVTVADQISLERNVTFNYPAPTITTISPTSGPTYDAEIEIYGTNFGNDPNIIDVTVDGEHAWLKTVSDTKLYVLLPPLVGANLIVVVTIGGQSAKSSQHYSVYAPTISDIHSEFDTDNSYADIVGQYFGAPALDAQYITFGGQVGSTSVHSELSTDQDLLIAYPPGIGTNIDLSVNVGGQQSNTVKFSYARPMLLMAAVDSNLTTMGGVNMYVVGNNFVPDGISAGPISRSNVTIGGIICQTNDPLWIDSVQVQCTIPKGIGRNLPLCVSVGGQASTSCLQFTYPGPAITNFMPKNGTTNGGTVLSITGTNFIPQGVSVVNSAILVGQNQCTDVIWVNSTLVTCKTPSGVGANKNISILVGGQWSAPAQNFSYNPPVIFNLENRTTPTTGGEITIIGEEFGNGTVLPLVKFNGTEVTATWLSFEKLRIVVPPGTGKNKTITVTVANQTSPGVSWFSYEAPRIESLKPSTTKTEGEVITIVGKNFGFGTTPVSATFEGASVQVTYISNTQIAIAIPPGSGTNKTVIVNVDGQQSNSDKNFCYGIPSVVSLDPSKGTIQGGTKVTINGLNFGTGDKIPTATIGGSSCTSVQWISHTKISCNTPSGSGRNKEVVVKVDGQTSSPASKWSYNAPNIERIDPDSASKSGNILISIHGSDLGSMTDLAMQNLKVTVGGKSCNVVAAYITLVTCFVPSSEQAGEVDVVLTLSGQNGTAKFTYEDDESSSEEESGEDETEEPESNSGGSPASIGLASIGLSGLSGPGAAALAGALSLALMSIGSGTSSSTGTSGYSTTGGTIGLGTTGSTTGATGGASNASNPAYDYIPYLPVLCPSANILGVTQIPSTISPMPLRIPVSTEHPSPVKSLVSILLSCHNETISPPISQSGCGLYNCTCDNWRWQKSSISCPCPLPTSCAHGFNTALPFCNIEYNASFVDFTNYAGQAYYSSALDADTLAHAAYLALIPHINPSKCPDLFAIKNVVCASAFPRVLSGAVLPICQTTAQQALQCFNNYVPSTFNGTCFEPNSCNLDDLASALQILPTADCTDLSQKVPVLSQTAAGPTAGGLSIFTGSNFGTTNGSVSALVRNRIANATWNSPSSISVQVPSGAGGPYSAAVAVGKQSSSPVQIFYYQAPQISVLIPNNGTTGNTTAIILEGTNFGKSSATARTANINNASVPLYWVLNDYMVIAMPPGIGKALVSVTVAGLMSNSVYFTYQAPTIISISPSISPSLSGGLNITIKGTNFVPAGYNKTMYVNQVSIGGNNCQKVFWINDTTVICTTPASVDGLNSTVVITVGNQTTSSSLFSYANPQVSSISPNRASTTGGIRVTITGARFGSNIQLVSVKIGNYTCSSLAMTVVNSKIECTIGPGIGGNLSVNVMVNSTNSNLFVTFSYDSPTITSVTNASPTFGPVTITGTNFIPNAPVSLTGLCGTGYRASSGRIWSFQSLSNLETSSWGWMFTVNYCGGTAVRGGNCNANVPACQSWNTAQSQTSLGSSSTLALTESSPTTLRASFSNGDWCSAANIYRRVGVTYTCSGNAAPAITSTSEPSTCVYDIGITIPTSMCPLPPITEGGSVAINNIPCMNPVWTATTIVCQPQIGYGKNLPLTVNVGGQIVSRNIFNYASEFPSSPLGDTASVPATSCNQIRAQRGALSTGIFYLQKSGYVFPVLCDFQIYPGRAATMLFKISAGVSGNPYDLWNNGVDVNANNNAVLNVAASSVNYVSSLLSDSWASVSNLSVRVYKTNVMKQYINFRSSTDKLSWFNGGKVVNSSWTDIPKTPITDNYGTGVYFSIAGDAQDNRRWYINNNFGGCPSDEGWMVLSHGTDPCDPQFFPSGAAKIVIFYSPDPTKKVVATFAQADTMIVWADIS